MGDGGAGGRGVVRWAWQAAEWEWEAYIVKRVRRAPEKSSGTVRGCHSLKGMVWP